MWIHFALFLLAGTALANHSVWREGYTYQYLVQTRAVTGASKVSEQFSGVLTKGDLILYVTEQDTLVVELRNKKYANFHTKLDSPWFDHSLENKVEFVNMPLSQKPYKAKFAGGKILELLADPEVPMWQVNIVKGLLSQLQYNEQTEEKKTRPTYHKLPTNDNYPTYTVREQSVSGNCDTTYDLMPLAEDKLTKANIVPIPDLADDKYIDIMKNKDFRKCGQLPTYQFTPTEGKTNRLDKFVMRTAKTNMIVSYNKNYYHTIRSSVTTDAVNVRPEGKDFTVTDVLTKLNLTLVRMARTEQKPVVLTDVKSAGNLTYTYDDPVLDTWTEPVLHDLELDSKSKESDESSSDESSASSQRHHKQPKHFKQSSEELNRREYGYLIRRPALHEGASMFTLQVHGVKRADLNTAELLKRATLLINEIASEIAANDDLYKQHTLEKFTILTNVLRHVNEKELTNLGNTLLPLGSGYKKDEKKAISWKVYRDAVTQTGTGAAFLTIRSWITSKKVKDLEAALIISRLPRTARKPTMEYIDAFYEFIRQPDVKKQMFLNTTAPYAFSELVRYVMVGDVKHVYPVRTFGKFVTTADKKKLTDTYIPYLSNELKKAYEAKQSAEIQLYTAVLGNLAHPDTIRVFEPYLEGNYNITTFQRMKMVMSLKTLSEAKPYLVRPIVYKIFQNENEDYRIRIVAVNILLTSNPSLRILQRVAERTNYETNPNVNSAVKSGLKNLANIRLGQYNELAKNARIAEKSLNRNIKIVLGQAYNYGQDYVFEEKDFYTWFTYTALDGKKSIVPDALKLRLGLNTLSPPNFQAGYAITDLSALLNLIKNMFVPTAESIGPTKVDEVASKLNIKIDKGGLVEGSLVLKSVYGVYFLSFDHHTLQNVLHEALKYQKSKIDERPNVSMTSLINWELTLIHPSEMGLPVSYRLKTPLLISSRNKMYMKGEMKPVNIKVSADLDTMLSGKVMSRIGFTALFENRHYLSGVDINTQVHGTGKFDAELNWEKKTIKLEYEPLSRSGRSSLFHYSVIPFTGSTESYFTPIYNDQNTQEVRVGNLVKKIRNYGKDGKVTVISETDNFATQKGGAVTNGNLYQRLMNYLDSMSFHYKKIDVTYDPPREDYKLSILLGYNKTNSINSAQERPELFKTIAKETEYVFKKDDNVPATVHKVEAHVKMTSNNIYYKCEGGVVELEPLMYGKLYGQCYSRGSDVLTVCAIGELYGTPSSCPTLDVTSKKEDGINVLVRYGKSCRDGKDIRIEGLTVQSPEVAQKIANSKEYQKAKKEKEEGNLGVTNSQKVCESIDTRDNVTWTATMDPKDLDKIYHNAIQTLGDYVIPGWEIDLTEPPQEYSWSKTGVINMKLKKLFPEEALNLTVFTPEVSINTVIDGSSFPTLKLAKPICTLGKTKVLTFDGLEYPIELKEYPYVLMISPTQQKYNQPYDFITKIEAIPDDKNVAILAKQLEDDRKELIIMNHDKMFKLLTSSSNSGVIKLNGENIEFKGNQAFLQEDQDSTILISRVTDTLYKVSMKTAGINIWYDGKRVQIEASSLYNGLVRGLCGNKDSMKKNEFITPKGCVVKDPKHFAILYAYLENVENTYDRELLEAQKAECLEYKNLPVDVITDRERRRHHPDSRFLFNSRHSCYLLTTDVVTNIDEICFSVRPLLKCSQGCISDHTTTKDIAYFCQPKNIETLDLKRRVELGANPDFSQRTISQRQEVEVPTTCRRI